MPDFMGVLVEKAGYDNGWEYVFERAPDRLILGSARHSARVIITPGAHDPSWILEFSQGIAIAELKHSLPVIFLSENRLEAWSLDLLAALLHRAYDLAIAIPGNPLAAYETAVSAALDDDPTIRGTEREALVRQRIGQDLYRTRLMRYWNGCCAVTGCEVPEVLRASHAKPWVDCTSDAERLDVYNGFLLRADYDALFDSGLISFSASGDLLCSPRLSSSQRRELGLDQPHSLRKVAPSHEWYLVWHREKFGFSM